MNRSGNLNDEGKRILHISQETPKLPLTKTTRTAAYLYILTVRYSVIKFQEIAGSYAAVAAKTSGLRALVKSPMLAAKSMVKPAIVPSRACAEVTNLRLKMAPINNTADSNVLMIATSMAIDCSRK